MLNITINTHRKHCKGNKANIAKRRRHADEQTQKIKSIVLHKHSENETGENVKGSPDGLLTTSDQACVTVSAFWKQTHPREAKKQTNQLQHPLPNPTAKKHSKNSPQSLWNGKIGKGPGRRRTLPSIRGAISCGVLFCCNCSLQHFQ